jgi:hypothetical protein
MRVQDLLNEFSPPQPTDDELDQQLAQDQEAEEPEVEPTDSVAQTPVATTPVDNDFGSNIQILLNLSNELSNRDPKKVILDRFLSTVGSYFRDFISSNLKETIDFEKNLAKGDMASMFGANEVVVNEFVEYVKNISPEAAKNLEEMAAEFVKTFSKNKNIIKANLAAIAGIQLNTKGHIARLDADIEANAQKFAKKFNVTDNSIRKWCQILDIDLNLSPYRIQKK